MNRGESQYKELLELSTSLLTWAHLHNDAVTRDMFSRYQEDLSDLIKQYAFLVQIATGEKFMGGYSLSLKPKYSKNYLDKVADTLNLYYQTAKGESSEMDGLLSRITLLIRNLTYEIQRTW